MNGVGIGAAAKEYIGKTVKAAKINGGKHLEFNNKSALLKERGITDMWCYSHPETGDPMLYLEDAKGNLIREFNLKKQLEQVRNYFKKANADRNEVLGLKRKKKKIEEQCKEFDKLIGYAYGPGNPRDADVFYVVNGKQFTSRKAAEDEALLLNPKFKEVVEERNNIYRKIYSLSDNLNDYFRNLNV